jgi:hypothetical protein
MERAQAIILGKCMVTAAEIAALMSLVLGANL